MEGTAGRVYVSGHRFPPNHPAENLVGALARSGITVEWSVKDRADYEAMEEGILRCDAMIALIDGEWRTSSYNASEVTFALAECHPLEELVQLPLPDPPLFVYAYVIDDGCSWLDRYIERGLVTRLPPDPPNAATTIARSLANRHNEL